jgi:PAS domain S-box-containing protein
MGYPLKRILTVQPVLALVLPLTFMALLGWIWVLPEVRSDVEARQSELARAVAAQVERYLEVGVASVEGSAALSLDRGVSTGTLQQFLDAQIDASDTLSGIYALRNDGRVLAVGLRDTDRHRRADLVGIDLASTPPFRAAKDSVTPLWSETFLSLLTGRLSAAYTVGGPDFITIGEIDIARMSSFLKHITSGNRLMILIIDQKGQVIADQDGRYTAQQINLSNLPLVRNALDRDMHGTTRFTLDGTVLIGSMLQIPLVDWHVLVAQPASILYGPTVKTAWVVVAGLLAALICGIALTTIMARSLSRRFESLAEQAMKTVSGNWGDQWPESSVIEIDQLSKSLQSMSHSLHRHGEELRESERSLSALVESAPDAIFVTSGGRFLLCNRKMVELLGATDSDELVGKSVADHFVPQTGELTRLAFQAGEGGDGSRSVTEMEFLRSDGTTANLEVSGVPLRYAGNDAVVVFVHDVTERRQAELERSRMEQQLQHTQKLESLGILAGGIAHDFNNILTAIVGNADLAMMRLPSETPAASNIKQIMTAALRATDLARQMLAYSGKGKFVIESLDLNILLEEMVNMLEVSISKKAVLQLRPGQQIAAVEADATQLRQVIMNLVINASEAIGDRSGFITVTTGTIHCDRRYLDDLWSETPLPEGTYTFTEVTDNGCGMDRETMRRVFDPFFTTKFTGRGLGMAAVLGIIRGHRGAIKVYSEPGKGTSFKVLLPASTVKPDGDAAASADCSWRGSGRVLLADDEETVRIIGSEMLAELGYDVVTATDGKDALLRLAENQDWQFVVLDLTMPHMDGEQCYRELRLAWPLLKVIMTSGYNEQEVVQRFAGKGLAGFIQKPYKLDDLREAVRKLVG